MLFDTHCHLNLDNFKNDLECVLQEARLANVKFIINVGCDLDSSLTALKSSRKYKGCFATAGIHPHFSAKICDLEWNRFEKTAGDGFVAIGECGLDYYRDFSPRKKQREIFEKQIILSRALNLPLVIHNREAEDDLMAILDDYKIKGAVAHCFSGSRKYFDFCLKHKFFISFSGNVTYPKSSSVQEAVKKVPSELLLLETDAPYLSPQGLRGKRCEPKHIIYVRDEVAGLKNIPAGKIEELTTANALRCFRIRNE